MSKREFRESLFDMLMYRLGFVRVRHYEDICERYERLYKRFVGTRLEHDRVVKQLQEGGVI